MICMPPRRGRAGRLPGGQSGAMVLPMPPLLSCSRDSRTRLAAFLVVGYYWRQ